MAKNLALLEGSWQKVLIKVLLLLLVLFVVYSLIKKIKWKPTKEEQELQDYIDNVLPTTSPEPVDNSTPIDPDTINESEANLIANSLQVAMEGWGTDTSAMFNSLQCLNGASLQLVYASFGMRDYSAGWGQQSGDRDLIGWFNGELEYGWSNWYYNDCVPSCSTFSDNCGELDYMRAIWMRSNIPLTF